MAKSDSPLLYVARTIPTYRTGVLRRLNSRLGGRLVACYGPPPQGSSLSSIEADLGRDVRIVRLKNFWVGGEKLHVQAFLPALTRHGQPAAVIAEESPRSVSLPFLLAACRMRDVPIALWGHFSSNTRAFSPNNWADRYRLTLAKHADACVCYTDGIANLLKPYVSSDKLFVARNTLDTDTLFDIRTELENEGRESVRMRLGLPMDRPIIAFMGRLIKAKGTSTLLRVVEHLQRDSAAALVVIGDGPERGAMATTAAQRGLQHIVFTGALTRLEESAPYLFASDVMLLPGYVGLAVNHAFALGLPVVTHASPNRARYHSPEIEYVEHGRNGLIVQHGSVEEMATAVHAIVRDQERFSSAALEYARRQLSVDRMVDGLVSSVRYLESRHPTG